MSKLAEAQQVVIDPNMGALLEHLGGMRREQLENVACGMGRNRTPTEVRLKAASVHKI